MDKKGRYISPSDYTTMSGPFNQYLYGPNTLYVNQKIDYRWICSYCKRSNKDESESCISCGAPHN